MKPDKRFLRQSKDFWANVRTISQQAGYTVRGEGTIYVPSVSDMVHALGEVGLDVGHIVNDGKPTEFGERLHAYFKYRAETLNEKVEPRLMTGEQARKLYEQLHAELSPQCPLPMNKQKKEKKAKAYLTCIINMLVEANCGGNACNYDPRELTTVTRGGRPLRTMARRVDGAFPSPVNPVAVWEIKEYYYTTTFGSRVADGVYESLLDGMELEELREHEDIHIEHLLMVDSHYTWWKCGKSYLCRIIDMLHMGYVDEVLFGSEVAEELPGIVNGWIAKLEQRDIDAN